MDARADARVTRALYRALMRFVRRYEDVPLVVRSSEAHVLPPDAHIRTVRDLRDAARDAFRAPRASSKAASDALDLGFEAFRLINDQYAPAIEALKLSRLQHLSAMWQAVQERRALEALDARWEEMRAREQSGSVGAVETASGDGSGGVQEGPGGPEGGPKVGEATSGAAATTSGAADAPSGLQDAGVVSVASAPLRSSRGTSTMPTLLTPMGTVVEHTRHGYRGVIYGWDPRCLRGVEWATSLGLDPDAPFFHVLPDERDSQRLFGGVKMTRYVAAANLKILSPIEDEGTRADAGAGAGAQGERRGEKDDASAGDLGTKESGAGAGDVGARAGLDGGAAAARADSDLGADGRLVADRPHPSAGAASAPASISHLRIRHRALPSYFRSFSPALGRYLPSARLAYEHPPCPPLTYEAADELPIGEDADVIRMDGSEGDGDDDDEEDDDDDEMRALREWERQRREEMDAVRGGRIRGDPVGGQADRGRDGEPDEARGGAGRAQASGGGSRIGAEGSIPSKEGDADPSKLAAGAPPHSSAPPPIDEDEVAILGMAGRAGIGGGMERSTDGRDEDGELRVLGRTKPDVKRTEEPAGATEPDVGDEAAGVHTTRRSGTPSEAQRSPPATSREGGGKGGDVKPE